MELRPYSPQDLPDVLRLFDYSVHKSCGGQYTPEQLDAWAPAAPDTAAWADSLARHFAVTAWENGLLLGFADTAGDYFDRLYVHPDAQGRGVGTALAHAAEENIRAQGNPAAFVDASLTALPFFLSRGYCVVREQQVLRRGVLLKNFHMKKDFTPKKEDGAA